MYKWTHVHSRARIFILDLSTRCVPQVRDPSAPPLASLPKSYKQPIALIGCGPASISAGTYLARLGYQARL